MSGIWLVSHPALWVLFLLMAVVLVSVLRKLGALAEVVQRFQPGEPEPIKLAVGEVVPDLPLQTSTGERAVLAQYQGAPLALAIISPGCEPCRQLLATLSSGAAELEPGAQLVIVSLGDAATTQALVAQTSLPPGLPVLLAASDALHTQWGIRSTPTAVLLDAAGRFVRHHVGFTPPAVPAQPTPGVPGDQVAAGT